MATASRGTSGGTSAGTVPDEMPAALPAQRRLRRQRRVLAGLAAVAAVSGVWTAGTWFGILDFQLAGSGRRAVEVLRNLDRLDTARTSLDRDIAFIVAYVALAVVALRWIPRRVVRSERALRWAAVVATVGAPLADLRENALSRRMIARVADFQGGATTIQATLPDPADVDRRTRELTAAAQRVGDEVDGLAHQMLAVAITKWVLLFVLVAWAVSLLRQPLRPPHQVGSGGPDVRFPPPRTRARAEAPGDDPTRWDPAEGRTGISCSGGGVRSASFCLGALQALDNRGELARAEYVTAVSGGSYLAAAVAVAECTGSWAGVEGYPAGTPDAALDASKDWLPYAPGSPEESWFRRNSAYLASNAGEVWAGVARMVLGMGFNLLLLWLAIFAVARPIGWVLSSARVHPELRAREPSARMIAQPTTLGSDLDLEVRDIGRVDDTTYEFAVLVRADRPGAVEVWRPTLGASKKKEIRPVSLVPTAGSGIVADGTIKILRQPQLVIAGPSQIAAEINADPRRPTLQVQRQPRLTVAEGVALLPLGGLADRIEGALRVEDRPRIRQVSGTTGRPGVRFDGTDWLVGLGPLVLVTMIYLAKILTRSAKAWANRAFDIAIGVVGIIGIVLALLFLVLPWSVQEIPRRLASLAGTLPGVSTPPTGGDGDAGSVITVLFGAVGLSASSIMLAVSKQFRRRPMLVVKALSVVVLSGLAYVTLTSLVQMAAANGPTGRLTGLGLGSTVRWYPDHLKWATVLVVLLGLAVSADAHAWSVFPYYKRRLSRAFFLHRREPGRVEPLPYDTLTAFVRSDPAKTARIRPPRAEGDPPGPELVVCAAANTMDEGVAAAGRRSVSFTFSAREIGGPEIGYVTTPDYLKKMADRRARDVTLASAVAISGAAASPAMGKASLGPVGRLLAVLNVRLGVWLPNPCWVKAMDDGRKWSGRPGWPYFFRELLGQFRIDHRYVYVTDGGHWENLGLVELMRRGCTRIYCISAAGDGTSSFGTIGEAIALAREELGVEVDIELERLRPPAEAVAPPAKPLRRLVRRGRRVAPPTRTARRLVRRGIPAPMARQPWAKGTFTYPADPQGPNAEPVTGTLWIVEANLTDAMPWDVHAHSERWPLFPDDPTGDQLFNHRKFESYRQLGYHQVNAIFKGAAAP